jgi:hypothetical protein
MMDRQAEIHGLAGAPRSLPEFAAAFPSEEECIDYLFRQRFPEGWPCPVIGTTAVNLASGRVPIVRPPVVAITAARSVSRANTIMHRTTLPICAWFWAAFLVTHGPMAMIALQL